MTSSLQPLDAAGSVSSKVHAPRLWRDEVLPKFRSGSRLKATSPLSLSFCQAGSTSSGRGTRTLTERGVVLVGLRGGPPVAAWRAAPAGTALLTLAQFGEGSGGQVGHALLFAEPGWGAPSLPAGR